MLNRLRPANRRTAIGEARIKHQRQEDKVRYTSLSITVEDPSPMFPFRGDNEYEGALREEIQRLRSQRITSKPEPPREEPKPQRKASSIEDHMSSSGGSSDSSSSDESGSDSDSDSDAEPRVSITALMPRRTCYSLY